METELALGDNRSKCLSEQFAGLMETVLACERQWTVDDRIDAIIKCGRI